MASTAAHSNGQAQGQLSWREASKEFPCPICKSKSWCRTSGDGDWCNCRKESTGAISTKTDRNGDTYHVHRLTPYPERGPRWEPPTYSLADGDGERADADTLNRVYAALLDRLSLSATHERALRGRGLTAGLLASGYRSLPSKGRSSAIRAIIQEGLEEHLPRTPGFFVANWNGGRYWTLSGPVGILIPVRDQQGRIAGLIVRLDEPAGEAKYKWISSAKKKPPGPGSGAPSHFPLDFGIKDKATIRITEGALKADIATRLSGVYTIGLPSVSGWRRAEPAARALEAKEVLVAFDADARRNRQVADALGRLVHDLQDRLGDTVAIKLELWPEADGKGIDDLLAAGKRPEVLSGEAMLAAVEEIQAAALAADPPPAGPNGGAGSSARNGRPRIVLSMEEHETIAEAIAALASNDPDLYQRGGQLVRVTSVSASATRRLRSAGGPVIQPVPLADIRTRLTRAARIVQLVAGEEGCEEVQVHPPEWLFKGVEGIGAWPGIRHLEAVVDAPVLLPSGEILQTAGYNQATGLLYQPTEPYPEIPDRPSREQALQALQELWEMVEDFPFAKPWHRSAWLASFLTPLARFAFDGPSPLFLFNANIRGSGKGLLADLGARTITGREHGRFPYSNDWEEMRKTITAIAIQGERLVLFDNLDGYLGNPHLDAALTATEWQGRVLGKSHQPRIPLLATWYATGNNVLLMADTARRVLPICLLSPEEKPEERTGFKHPDLLAWVRQERTRLLSAALTVLAAYCHAGKPATNLKAWGSYEAWSGLVRGAVVWLGLDDPAIARDEATRKMDNSARTLQGLLAGWRELDPEGLGLTCAQALELLDSPMNKLFFPTMRAIIGEAFNLPVGKLPSARQLGKKLDSFSQRVSGGDYFVGTPSHGSVMKWTIRRYSKTPEGGIGGFGGFGGFATETSSNACPRAGNCGHARDSTQDTTANTPSKPSKPSKDEVFDA